MNRATRDKLVSGTNQKDLTTGSAVWETPPLVFAKLNEDFGPFDVDLTADALRHLCPVWFGPDSNVGQETVFNTNWRRTDRKNGFSNPPYGPFVVRLLFYAKDYAIGAGFSSTLLLPMRVTKAFKAHILKGAAQLLFCDSRITFFENGVPRLNEKAFKAGKATADPAVFDSIIVRYLPGVYEVPSIGVWHVPKHVTAEDLERAVTRRREQQAA